VVVEVVVLVVIIQEVPRPEDQVVELLRRDLIIQELMAPVAVAVVGTRLVVMVVMVVMES
jgi:hypothetical protein|tara:strand:- start:36 stop:215 length:180 start_codon:yes stop_codon:yes gene_type:complete